MKIPKQILIYSILTIPAALWLSRSRKGPSEGDNEAAEEASDEALEGAISILSNIPSANAPPPGAFPPSPAPPPKPAPPPPKPTVPKPKRKLSADEKELLTKLSKLVTDRYQGSTEAAFYDFAGSDQLLGASELEDLLEAADVGNFVTRSSWASAIIKKMDASGDKRISWAEYVQAVNV